MPGKRLGLPEIWHQLWLHAFVKDILGLLRRNSILECHWLLRLHSELFDCKPASRNVTHCWYFHTTIHEIFRLVSIGYDCFSLHYFVGNRLTSGNRAHWRGHSVLWYAIPPWISIVNGSLGLLLVGYYNFSRSKGFYSKTERFAYESMFISFFHYH